MQLQSQHSDRDVSSPMSVDSHDTDGLKDEEDEEEEDEEAKKAKVHLAFTSLKIIHAIVVFDASFLLCDMIQTQRTFYEKIK